MRFGMCSRYFLRCGLPYLLVLAFLVLVYYQKGWRRKVYLFCEAALAIILARGIVTEVIRYFYHEPRPFSFYNFTPLFQRNRLVVSVGPRHVVLRTRTRRLVHQPQVGMVVLWPLGADGYCANLRRRALADGYRGRRGDRYFMRVVCSLAVEAG